MKFSRVCVTCSYSEGRAQEGMWRGRGKRDKKFFQIEQVTEMLELYL